MKITNIEPQRDPNRFNIYIDNKFAFGLSAELKFKHKLELNMDVDNSFIENILKAEEINKVTGHALNLLSYRQRSEKELYDRLKRKGFEDYFIEKALDYCRENSYLNDKLFAENFIKDKVNINKLGSQRIKYELNSKGVSHDIIENVLQIDNEDEYENCMEIAAKRLKSYKDEDKDKTYRKLGSFLQRRGYPYDIISRVLRELLR